MRETEATTQIRAVSEPRVEPTPAPSTTEYHDDTTVPRVQHNKIVKPTHKYDKFTKQVMAKLLNNKSPTDLMYTKTPRRTRGAPTRHNHFTRSRLQGFLAQSVIQLNEHGFEHHIANHVYHHDTGIKQSIDALLKGPDSSTWTASLSNEFGCLAQSFGKQKTRRLCKRY